MILSVLLLVCDVVINVKFDSGAHGFKCAAGNIYISFVCVYIICNILSKNGLMLFKGVFLGVFMRV